jgi:hypothetical protein
VEYLDAGQRIVYAAMQILTGKLAPNLDILAGSAGEDPGHEEGAGRGIGVLAGPDGICSFSDQHGRASLRSGETAIERQDDLIPVRAATRWWA